MTSRGDRRGSRFEVSRGGNGNDKVNEALSELDALTLKQLQSAGANLDKLTEVINYLFFAKAGDAKQAAVKLSRGGYSVQGPTSTSEGYMVSAKTQFVPNPDYVASLRRSMEAVAEEFRGDYDGWEAAVTR